jgi:recombination protein RecA
MEKEYPRLVMFDLAVSGISLERAKRYSYKDERIGQGRENARLFLKEHQQIMEEIEKKILEKHGTSGGAKKGE